jgi:hypothetical protein
MGHKLTRKGGATTSLTPARTQSASRTTDYEMNNEVSEMNNEVSEIYRKWLNERGVDAAHKIVESAFAAAIMKNILISEDTPGLIMPKAGTGTIKFNDALKREGFSFKRFSPKRLKNHLKNHFEGKNKIPLAENILLHVATNANALGLLKSYDYTANLPTYTLGQHLTQAKAKNLRLAETQASLGAQRAAVAEPNAARLPDPNPQHATVDETNNNGDTTIYTPKPLSASLVPQEAVPIPNTDTMDNDAPPTAPIMLRLTKERTGGKNSKHTKRTRKHTKRTRKHTKRTRGRKHYRARGAKRSSTRRR